MILECGACSKMYRVRDDVDASSMKCRACGAALKVSANATASTPAVGDGRVKELEEKVARLERELSAAKASSSGPSLSQASWGFGDGGDPGRAEALERQLLDLRSATDKKLAEKDRELAQARESADRAEAERRRIEGRVQNLESTQSKAVDEKQKTIDALDASLASYRGKIDGLQKRIDELESARTSERGSLESRVRENEAKLRAESERAAEQHRAALSELRAELEQQIAEKDRQISDGRQALDREAGERRALKESVTRLQEQLDRTVAEKDQALSSLKGAASSAKSKADALQKRLDDLEELRRSDHENYTTKLRAREGAQARVQEAGHLASDLDLSLDSVADLLKGLRDRVKRLKGNLNETSSAPATPVSAPPPATVEADSPIWKEPELSSTDFAPEPEPAPAPKAQPAPEPAASTSDDLDFSEEKPMMGRTEEPTRVIRKAPEPEPKPAPEPVPAAAAAAGDDDAFPLISPAEDEAPAPAPAPAPKAPEPPKGPERRQATRFSWKKT